MLHCTYSNFEFGLILILFFYDMNVEMTVCMLLSVLVHIFL